MNRLTCFALILTSFLLASCAGGKTPVAPLTPLPQEYTGVRDPSDMELAAALDSYIERTGGPKHTLYEFTRIDLNGDGRREGIVMFTSPYSYWCDINGCKMAVMQAHNMDFSLLSEVSPVRGPLLVSEAKTNGWRDIVVHVSGRMDRDAQDIALRFDGRGYPSLPEAEAPMVLAMSSIKGVRIFP